MPSSLSFLTFREQDQGRYVRPILSPYGLTEKGRGLFHVVVGLRQWGEAFLFSRNEEHSVLVDRSSQESIHTLELRSQHGKLLTSNDVIVKKVCVHEGSRSKILG